MEYNRIDDNVSEHMIIHCISDIKQYHSIRYYQQKYDVMQYQIIRYTIMWNTKV